MVTDYASVRYELLRPAQLCERRKQCPIAYLPAGSLEWHSFQNPLGTDSLKAHGICCEAACRHGGVVLPPFYLGLHGDANWGPEGWEHCTLGYNQPEMQVMAFEGMARALSAAGWKVLVGVTGHDVESQREAMEVGISKGVAGSGAKGFAVLEGQYHDVDEDIPFGMDHAGAWETSCMMHLHGETVDLDALREHLDEDVEQTGIKGAQGIGGYNPLRYATPRLGEKIVQRMAENIARRALELLRS